MIDEPLDPKNFNLEQYLSEKFPITTQKSPKHQNSSTLPITSEIDAPYFSKSIKWPTFKDLDSDILSFKNIERTKNLHAPQELEELKNLKINQLECNFVDQLNFDKITKKLENFCKQTFVNFEKAVDYETCLKQKESGVGEKVSQANLEFKAVGAGSSSLSNQQTPIKEERTHKDRTEHKEHGARHENLTRNSHFRNSTIVGGARGGALPDFGVTDLSLNPSTIQLPIESFGLGISPRTPVSVRDIIVEVLKYTDRIDSNLEQILLSSNCKSFLAKLFWAILIKIYKIKPKTAFQKSDKTLKTAYESLMDEVAWEYVNLQEIFMEKFPEQNKFFLVFCGLVSQIIFLMFFKGFPNYGNFEGETTSRGASFYRPTVLNLNNSVRTHSKNQNQTITLPSSMGSVVLDDASIIYNDNDDNSKNVSLNQETQDLGMTCSTTLSKFRKNSNNSNKGPFGKNFLVCVTIEVFTLINGMRPNLQLLTMFPMDKLTKCKFENIDDFDYLPHGANKILKAHFPNADYRNNAGTGTLMLGLMSGLLERYCDKHQSAGAGQAVGVLVHRKMKRTLI